METLYEIREKLIEIYYKRERIIVPVTKLVLFFLVFLTINQQIGYNARLKGLIVVFGISFICAFLPVTYGTFIVGLVSVGHIYSASFVLAGIAILVLLLLYCLLIGFAPKWSYVVLCIPILFLIEVPYIIPVLLGLIASPISIFATTAGVIVYYFFMVLKEVATIGSGTSVEEVLETYQHVVDGIMGKEEMFLTIIVFATVTLVVYVIRKIPFSYSFQVAILIGLVLNMIGFLVGGAKMGGNEGAIGWMMMGTVVSGIILYIIWFFRLTLEYNRMEQLEFEDEDYYYYVKAIPKVKMTLENRNVKRIVGEHNLQEDINSLKN